LPVTFVGTVGRDAAAADAEMRVIQEMFNEPVVVHELFNVPVRRDRMEERAVGPRHPHPFLQHLTKCLEILRQH
jgi:hypothetical protein